MENKTPIAGPFKAAKIGNNFVISTDIKKSKSDRKRNIVIAELRDHRLTKEEIKANADLLSAAPDLLQALEAVVQLQASKDDNKKYKKLFHKTWDKVFLAMDKAKGITDKMKSDYIKNL